MSAERHRNGGIAATTEREANMAQDAQPGITEGIVPIFQDLTVETSDGEGRAIAYQWLGAGHGVYLVVSKTEQRAPRWYYDNDINAAYIGTRPGAEPMVARA